ncbi:MAG: hypothetical protein KAT15_27175, partial [Bacteroidales bacterium]|nr:hypothetical protein [Bacteroidales bacterium]
SDPAGRIIRILDSGLQVGGNQSVLWDGKGEEGNEVSPGFYLLSIETGYGRLRTHRVIKQH